MKRRWTRLSAAELERQMAFEQAEAEPSPVAPPVKKLFRSAQTQKPLRAPQDNSQ
jgi:hypothetical protein